MACPTKEEYEKAMGLVVFLKNSIAMENKRREKLINELCTSHKILEDYKKNIRREKRNCG